MDRGVLSTSDRAHFDEDVAPAAPAMKLKYKPCAGVDVHNRELVACLKLATARQPRGAPVPDRDTWPLVELAGVY